MKKEENKWGFSINLDEILNREISEESDFYRKKRQLMDKAKDDLEAIKQLYVEHPYAIETERLNKELKEFEPIIKSFMKLFYHIEYSTSPKEEHSKHSSNETLHPLDKIVSKNLYKEINDYLDIHSIDRNNKDAYSKAVHDVTTNLSRTVYKDGFEEELFKHIEDGKKVLENIKS